MQPINIYALTRIRKTALLHKAEKQMSKRPYYLKIKEWEVDGLKALADRIFGELPDISAMNFYYSFQIPKLGKEFDLLQVDEHQVINIELKSKEVSDEKIKKQLELNRQYLALLGKSIRSYTYISSQDRLVRLTNSGNLIESSFESLCRDLLKGQNRYEDHLEKLFLEEKYLISPLTDPDKFLRREYFLTSQQKDIKKKVLKTMRENPESMQGFTGLPGTGKTLLLYDIALELTEKERVCVLHFGAFSEELLTLDKRLKRVDFYPCKGAGELFREGESGAYEGSEDRFPDFRKYSAVLVDEGHRITEECLQKLMELAVKEKLPILFSYDCEDAIAGKEKSYSMGERIEASPNFVRYRLTNRIRMNAELSSFIHCIMQSDIGHRRKDYPSISVSYAENEREGEALLADYMERGYIYIRGAEGEWTEKKPKQQMEASMATCREFDRVVMVLDEKFYYDASGQLLSRRSAGGTRGTSKQENVPGPEDSPVRILFHGLSRAKEQIALIVLGNEAVFERIVICLQGPDK